eukprot:jgi/Undpi1/4562/HiC_scaffold_18.g07916.m1
MPMVYVELQPTGEMTSQGITVELSEIQQVGDDATYGQYELSEDWYLSLALFAGVEPLDTDCPNSGKCMGLLTRDRSLDLDSRYGCTEPSGPSSDDEGTPENVCYVTYGLSTATSDTQTIASVRIALHPESTRTLTIMVNGDGGIEEWEATSETTELQEIPGLEGLETSQMVVMGVYGAGDYLGILEVEIWVEVDEVAVLGTSASTRTAISAAATTDAASAMNTLDGDTTDSSSWTCSSGEVCEITYDLQAPESLEQVRIAFSESSDGGGQLNFMTAGESGIFSTAREGIEAGGRPIGTDGLQTFGGIRALARYVKIEVVAPTGGSVVINEVQFRVGDDTPIRPVAEKAWLKPTGDLPLGYNWSSDRKLSYDSRVSADGGCDSPAHFEGCQAYYMKDGDLDSRWACGPLAAGNRFYNSEDCEVGINLNYFRYVRQVQIAFHMGDEQHDEFSIEALTAQGWMTVVGAAITSGDTTDYQTFDVSVHASAINIKPKFHQFNQWFSIKEIVVLERRKNDFIAGTVPVFGIYERFTDDDDSTTAEASAVEIPTRFRFDIPNIGDSISFAVLGATVSAVRMRFPAGRTFVFEFEYTSDVPTETFTSAGGDNEWETFTLSQPTDVIGGFEIFAVSGPTFASVPDYPALRVVDFQVVGEPEDNGPGYFNMVSTTLTEWNVVPDIIGDGVSEQFEIMTAICETKGAAFDGTDCVGDLDDSTVHIEFQLGEYYLDGPIFVKSGVTISGQYSSEFTTYTEFILYEGDNIGVSGEDGIIVIDSVTGAEERMVGKINMLLKEDWTGDIVPDTVGNLCLDVRNSKEIVFDEIAPRACRTGAGRFTDSSNITTFLFWESNQEIGNYMELTRVDDFYVRAFPDMSGLLMDTCNNVVWQGLDDFDIPDPRISPPVSGDQTASVVVTGDSSNIVIMDCDIGPGAEPRILMESTATLTLDNIFEYEEAVTGDCIVGVPAGTTEDSVIQLNSEQALTKSGDCWVLE